MRMEFCHPTTLDMSNAFLTGAAEPRRDARILGGRVGDRIGEYYREMLSLGPLGRMPPETGLPGTWIRESPMTSCMPRRTAPTLSSRGGHRHFELALWASGESPDRFVNGRLGQYVTHSHSMRPRCLRYSCTLAMSLGDIFHPNSSA